MADSDDDPIHCAFCGGAVESPLFLRIPFPAGGEDRGRWQLVVPCGVCCVDPALTDARRERFLRWLFPRPG